MLLEDIASLHHQFKIEDLFFKSNDFDFENNKIIFQVYDDGGLKVGEFVVEYDGVGHLEFNDSEDFPNTLERIRRDGYSNELVHHIRKTINNLNT